MGDVGGKPAIDTVAVEENGMIDRGSHLGIKSWMSTKALRTLKLGLRLSTHYIWPSNFSIFIAQV
jgi:hypothetical protein